MRLWLLVNPVCSGYSEETATSVREALAADHEVRVVETDGRGHGIDLAREAAAEEAAAMVVLGGDGTANEVANGLAGSNTALAALPGGSTNVFARTVGLPNDVAKAAGRLREALAARSVKRIGLGAVDERYFLFHVGLGYDAAVVHQVERYATLKRRIGQAVFVYAAVDTWLRHYDHSRPRFRLEHGGETVDDGYFGMCLNSNPYTFLGPRPLDLAPDAALDGPMAILTVRTAAFFTVLRLIGSAVAGGKALRAHPLVDYRTPVEEATMSGYGPVPYQVDGDFCAETETLRLRHRPDALDVVWPLGVAGPDGGGHDA